MPQEGEEGVETWLNDSWRYSGNANVWSMLSGDDELGYVYLPTGTPTNDYYGGHRPGDNLFAESIICVDVETGRKVWHFQAVHHGLWDYDFPAAPNLLDVVVDGRPIKALAQVSKQGFLYAFERVTGEPIWPIEERPVPTETNIPGEVPSSTQPFPTRPAPFEYQGVTIDDLVDFTPEIRALAIEAVEGFRLGPLFTPPDRAVAGVTRGTLFRPPGSGAASWSGAAVDPRPGSSTFRPRTTRRWSGSTVRKARAATCGSRTGRRKASCWRATAGATCPRCRRACRCSSRRTRA